MVIGTGMMALGSFTDLLFNQENINKIEDRMFDMTEPFN